MADKQMTVDEAKAAEAKAYEEAAAASRSLVASVQHGGLLEKTCEQVADETAPEDVTQALVTKAFTLNTDDKRRIRFPVGVRRVPKALMDHWYVKAHGVQPYEMRGASPDVANAVIVPPDLPAEVEIGDRKVPITTLVLSTVRDLGLSAGIWNALPDHDKRQLIQDKIRVSQQAAKAEAEPPPDAKGGKGKK